MRLEVSIKLKELISEDNFAKWPSREKEMRNLRSVIKVFIRHWTWRSGVDYRQVRRLPCGAKVPDEAENYQV